MQERHRNREQYFKEQSITTEKYVIPFIESVFPLQSSVNILEVGCGEGGNMLPFLRRGLRTVGVDLNKNKIANARKFYAQQTLPATPEFYHIDIYDWQTDEKYDLIMLRDVLEHIHHQERFMQFVKKFLKPNGKIFLGFPPWQNPYGGHQQMFDSFIARLPYIHLLPKFLYRGLLSLAKEDKSEINMAMEVKQTGITIERFLRIVKKEQYRIDRMQLYLINPNYEVKFGLKPRKQAAIISHIPWIRNFITTTVYVVLSQNEE